MVLVRGFLAMVGLVLVILGFMTVLVASGGESIPAFLFFAVIGLALLGKGVQMLKAA